MLRPDARCFPHKTRHTGFIIFVLMTLACCQNEIPEWPKYAFESLWIPQEAQQTKYYFIRGSYQRGYEVKICYPADDFINRAVNEMQKRNWRRLEFDSANPGLKLNYARGLGGTWSRFLDQNRKDVIYQWIEDWRISKRTLCDTY